MPHTMTFRCSIQKHQEVEFGNLVWDFNFARFNQKVALQSLHLNSELYFKKVFQTHEFSKNILQVKIYSFSSQIILQSQDIFGGTNIKGLHFIKVKTTVVQEYLFPKLKGRRMTSAK